MRLLYKLKPQTQKYSNIIFRLGEARRDSDIGCTLSTCILLGLSNNGMVNDRSDKQKQRYSEQNRHHCTPELKADDDCPLSPSP